ncbi:hypothetical protein Tco_0411546, partial [Tanacetum coccineum]
MPEADMKQIIHQRIFESGSYKSLPEHVALYEALEASMERVNRDEFLAEKDKSQKRRRDDQDPPPPPPDSDLSKKKRHDSDASGSKQSPPPQSSAWKTSDTRESPSSSSKQKSVPYFKQPVKDVPILDDMNISNSEDTTTAHLPKIKTRPGWLKPVPEEDRPETSEPDWIIPPNDLPDAENNWASSYQDPDEFKLLRQTSDMGSFINWFCKRNGKKKLSKADLEGPTFKVVQPFHDNSISLQFQMEECHLLLTDQVDLVNPEGHRVVPDVSKPLPLGGPPEDYTIVSKPHAVIYSDRNDQKKMMGETEVHKFSDGTLNRILDKLDHMVKDFKLFKYNSSMETRIWSEDDKRRSKEFMEVIEERLKTRIIFRSLESFVSGRLRDDDYKLI